MVRIKLKCCVHICQRSSLFHRPMLFKWRALSIFTFGFKRQLSSSPNLSQNPANVRKFYPSLPPSPLTNSVAFPEWTHFIESHIDQYLCSRVLQVSAKLGFLRTGKQVHAHLMKSGLFNILSLQNQLLQVYVKCKAFDDVEILFDEMRVKKVVTWNTVICGVVVWGCGFRSSLYLGFLYFRRMLLDGVASDHITFNGLLRACVELDDIEVGRQLHCFIVKLGFVLNCFVSSALVDLYGKCRLVRDARRVFDGVACRDLVLWNVMVSCYVLNCLADEAFEVFNWMRFEGVKGDEFTFSSLLNSCGTFGSFKMGKQIHGFITKQSFDVDVLVASALVDMYAKNGDIEDARRAFDQMAAKNVVSWNTMVVGYGQHGYGTEAMRLLRDMFQENLYPDELSVTSILSSCGNLSITRETMQVHAYVVKNGLQAFLSIGNSLINAYSKCGSIDNAFKCFGLVTNPDLVTWTSIIGAFAFHGISEKSIEIFEKMLSQGVRPDTVVFLVILSACSHSGLVNEGLHYFKLMSNAYQIVPDSEHYTCLVDLLGRAGLLDDAFNILASMPVKPSSDTFAAFIGACKVHGNVGLAEWAAEKLLELEPGNPVNYSLVSNMYASEGRWFDATRIRKMMRDYCNYKVRGSSWM